MEKLIKSLLDSSFKYTLEDLDCSLCLYYGGKKDKKPICLAEECCCAEEIKAAKRTEKKI